MTDHSDASKLAASSLKWTSAIEILSRTASPIVFIALAALLPPSDFGLLGIATVAVSFMQIFIDNGLGRALIQFKADAVPIEAVANATFWVNAGLSVVLYALVFLLAPAFAQHFKEPALVSIIRVLGVQVIVASFASVQQALLQRDFAFKRLLAVKFASAFVPGVISVVLALQGYGVWSLVIGALAMALVNSAAIWVACSWKPSLRFIWHDVMPILHFGMWTLVEALASWFIFWGDTLVVANFLGVEQVGLYRVACNIALVLFTVMLNPLNTILYPYLSVLQKDNAALRDVFSKLNRLVTAIAIPAGLGVLLLAPATVPLVLQTRWTGLGIVLGLVSLREGISRLAGINPELYRAIGRPDINVRIIFITVAFYMPVYLLAAPFGLFVFVIARIVVTIAGLFVHAVYTSRLLGVDRLYLLYDSRRVVFACVVMGAAVLLCEVGFVALGLNAYLSLAAIVAIGVGVYGYMMWKLDPDLTTLAARLMSKATSLRA